MCFLILVLLGPESLKTLLIWLVGNVNVECVHFHSFPCCCTVMQKSPPRLFLVFPLGCVITLCLEINDNRKSNLEFNTEARIATTRTTSKTNKQNENQPTNTKRQFNKNVGLQNFFRQIDAKNYFCSPLSDRNTSQICVKYMFVY